MAALCNFLLYLIDPFYNTIKMNKFFIAAFLIPSALSFAQETKKVVTRVSEPPTKTVYYVLRDQPDIKHGPCTRTYLGLSEKGLYDHNARVGVWEFYDERGRLVQKIDFTKHEIILSQPFVAKFWLLENGEGKERLLSEIDNEPFMLGGFERYARFITHTLRYPAEARKAGVMGNVVLSATITKEGVMIDEKVEKGPGHGLNEEALRIIQSLQEEWYPLRIDGEPKDAKILLSIGFKFV